MSKKKQQLFFVSYVLWGGGQEKVMYYLAHYLDRNVFEPHAAYLISKNNVPVVYDPSIPLYCLDPNIGANQETTKASRRRIGIRSYLLNLVPSTIKERAESFILGNLGDLTRITHAIWVHLRYANKIREILSKLEEDAIIVSFQEGPAVQAWLNQIYSSHSYVSFLCAPESFHLRWLHPDPRKFIVEKWMFSNACRSARYVTVPNQWMKDDMGAEFGVPSKKIKIIPNPIDCHSVAQQSEMPLKLDVDLAGKTVFVQLARLDLQKNHVLTVEACEILRRKYDNFVVLLIGDGSEKARIQEMVAEKRLQKHMIFLGEKANPYPYLKVARSSILTSTFEASPLALIESMFLGAVPVSVDCIAGPADLLDNGRCGLLVPPNDPSSFAEAMFRIASDETLWQRLREAGTKHARNFDISRFIDKWTDMLLDVSDAQRALLHGSG
jgi:glycosyltransferase involved in cell wall biosynthesis